MESATTETTAVARITRTFTKPDVGIHRNIDDGVYHGEWDACSKHGLDSVQEYSPAHARYWKLNPPEPTPAMVLGSALHTAVLEQDKFADRFTMAGQCCGITSKKSRCSNQGSVVNGDYWYCHIHAPESATPPTKCVITREEIEQIRRMTDAMLARPVLRGIIEGQGDNELAVVWDTSIDFEGVPYALRCKSKWDMWRPTFGDIIFDVKTCTNASPDAVSEVIARYGYHRQGAFYVDGGNAVGVESIKPKGFGFIFIEKEPPFGVAGYLLTPDAIDAGRAELWPHIKTYAACERLNNWWGYETDLADVSLPRWKLNEIMRKEKERMVDRVF